MTAMSCSGVYIDPQIIECAAQDLIEDDLPADVLPIAQFILDHDRRCVIPYERTPDLIRDAIAYCLPRDRRVIFIDEAYHWNRRIKARLQAYKPESGAQYQFVTESNLNARSLIKDRDCIIVAKTDLQAGYFLSWLGKLFPEAILYCEYQHQYALGARGGTNTALAAAAILSPTIGLMPMDSIMARGIERTLPLCSAYNGLISEKKSK